MNKGNNAIHNTLKQIFDGRDKNNGYILYNDENPAPNADDDGTKGHIKGVLAFNKKNDSAILLTHSTPRFPAVKETELPDDERRVIELLIQGYLLREAAEIVGCTEKTARHRRNRARNALAEVLGREDLV